MLISTWNLWYNLSVFVTYAIIDPKTKLTVYVGQTSDFAKRRRQHETTFRLKSRQRSGSLKRWLQDLHKAKSKPKFLVLEVVETEAESIDSENKWVEKFAAIDHPLLNGWSEHKSAVADQKAKKDAARRNYFARKNGAGKPPKH